MTKGKTYPDTDDRIDTILQIINPPDTDAMWSVAVLAYRLWDQHFKIGLDWSFLGTYKELYYNIKQQMKK